MRRIIPLALVAVLVGGLTVRAAEAHHGSPGVVIGTAVGLALAAPFLIVGSLLAPFVAPPPPYRYPAVVEPPPYYSPAVAARPAVMAPAYAPPAYFLTMMLSLSRSTRMPLELSSP